MGGGDAPLQPQQLDRCLASADYLHTDTRFCLDAIMSANKALRYLGTFALVALHLFSASARHFSEVVDPLHLI